MAPQPWGVTTRKGERVFLHIMDPDVPDRLVLPGTEGLNPVRAHVFGTETAVHVAFETNVEMDLSGLSRDPVDTVIEMEISSP